VFGSYYFLFYSLFDGSNWSEKSAKKDSYTYKVVFDIEYFHHNPKPFFTLAKELFPSGKYRPNYIHYFLRMLYDRGMLLRDKSNCRQLFQ
jgi:NAD-dependent deacetylase sirtuin 3